MLYKVRMSCRRYSHEVVKGGEDEAFAGVRLLRCWQIELMDGREAGSLRQQLSIISQSPEAWESDTPIQIIEAQ